MQKIKSKTLIQVTLQNTSSSCTYKCINDSLRPFPQKYILKQKIKSKTLIQVTLQNTSCTYTYIVVLITLLLKLPYFPRQPVCKKPTAPCVPRRSPIQVLTGLNAA